MTGMALKQTLFDNQDARTYFSALAAQARNAGQAGVTIADMRAAAAAFADSPLAHTVPADVVREDITIPSGSRAAWFTPPIPRGSAPVLYLHGGGYVCGSVDGARGLAAQIARVFAAPVFAVGYRQAPECPIPAAIEDAYASYAWLTTQSAEPITIVGDSAGGQLAMHAAVLAAKAGLPTPASIVAIAPWLELSMSSDSWRRNRDRDASTLEMGLLFRAAYLNGQPPQAASIARRDMGLLPRFLIVMGDADLGVDDAVAFATDAGAAGVEVALDLYAGLPHNFVRYAHPISVAALNRAAAFVRRAA